MPDTYVGVGGCMERESTCHGAARRMRTTWEPIRGAQTLCSYWLQRAERRVSGVFARKLKKWGLIASEWAAIREMYGTYEPIRRSPVELGRVIGMTKGGASKLIDRLVAKRLV